MKHLSTVFACAFLIFNAFSEEDLLSTLDTADGLNEETFVASAEDVTQSTSLLSSDPDFYIRDFYKRRIPANEVKVPNPKNGELLMWKTGTTMRDLKLPAGEYSVIRVMDKSRGYHIRFIGKLLSDGKHATVTEAANEILPGDYIVKENYSAVTLPPLTGDGGAVAKKSKVLGEVFSMLEPDQDEEVFFSGTRQLIGAKFNDYRGGNTVSIGASFEIRRDGEAIAKAVVVDADLDLATLYIYKSEREVKADDEIFSL